MFTAGELARQGAFEGTSANVAVDWIKGSAWQAGQLGHTNYHGGTGYAYNGTSSGGVIHNTSGAAGSMYQQITIPAGTVNPILSFWTKVTTEETTTTVAYDTVAAQIQNTSGTVLQTLVTLSNLNSGTGGPHTAAGKYTLHEFSLAAYVGQTIRVNFQATTDGSKGTTFRVDDVSLAPAFVATPGTSRQVVGYLPDYRYSLFGQMNLNYVTHINYFSIGFNSSGVLTQPSATFNSHVDTVVAAAHALGKQVSITLGPGQPYTAMGASAAARAQLASDVKAYILAHNLDGVDVDWEPPATGANQVNYGLLIDDLYAQLNPIGKKITAAVNPWTKEIPVAASKLMNWINVMCYDFDYANNSTYAASIDGMNQWTYYGVAKDKLVMGVPFYGRYGTSWSDTHSKTYNTILNDIKSLTGSYPAFSTDSYVDGGGNTVYFNGVTTMEMKMAWLRDNGYAGAMTWELGQDFWNASVQYDRYSHTPILSSMIRTPAWLTPAAGSLYDLVGSEFIANGGTVTFNADAGVTNPGLTVEALAGSTLLIDAAQRWSGITASGTGKFDLKSNRIVVDHSGTSPLGSWNGSTYTGITGLIKSGRNGGAWNGSGIVTSQSNAQPASALTTIGVAEASYALNFSSGTKVWNGYTVDATTVLMRYTFVGDGNLDGVVNGDDYFKIDSNAGLAGGAVGFGRGDFNFDGRVDADDYFLIDQSYMKTYGVAPASVAASAPVVANAVPPKSSAPAAAAVSAYARLVGDESGELL